MDPRMLRFAWDKVRLEEMSGTSVTYRIMRSTILESTGAIECKTSSGLDVDDEVEKWIGEFGVVTAEHIEKMVREAMLDYEYLRERRLRVD